VTRFKISYALSVLGVLALFAVFILFRDDAALISALSAAGAVAAAVFAAVAAFGSVRAADESSAAAKRAHEAVARNAQPRLRPSFSLAGGKLLGTVSCGSHRGAADVMVAWMLENSGPVTEQRAAFEAGTGLTVELHLPATADLQRELKLVWIDYWDEGRTGHWRDTWRIGTEPPHQSALVLSESQLIS
jgi:hypothetical protein